MTPKAQRQVHPAASALLILLVLGAVQAIWWRFLVYHDPGKRGGPPPGGMPSSEPQVTLVGRTDVIVTSFAGDQNPGDSDGPGHAARFDRPTGLALDSHGNILVADTGNHRIRRISPLGETVTVAGGEAGYADGPVDQARFNAPCGICVGPDDAIYVADTGNRCLRRIQNGQVTTLGARPQKLGVGSMMTGISYVPEPKPALLVADTTGRALQRRGLDGVVESEQKVAAEPVSVVGAPRAAAIPGAGALMLGSQTLKDIPIESSTELTAKQRQILLLHAPTGLGRLGQGWLVSDNGFGAVFFVLNGRAQLIAGYASSAGPIRSYRDSDGSTAMFGKIGGIVSDEKRYAYVADTANNIIRRLDLSEVIGH